MYVQDARWGHVVIVYSVPPKDVPVNNVSPGHYLPVNNVPPDIIH